MTEKNRPIPLELWQEYLKTLDETKDASPEKKRERLLISFAELQYGLHGGALCSVCRAHVRHVLPVRSEREDGTVLDYACLCTRCLEGEKALATRVRVGIGEAYVEYTRKT